MYTSQVLDDKNVRRRFRASNYQSTTRVKPFICTMPMRLDEGWNQIQFNLSDFTRRAYGTNYIETLRVQVPVLVPMEPRMGGGALAGCVPCGTRVGFWLSFPVTVQGLWPQSSGTVPDSAQLRWENMTSRSPSCQSPAQAGPRRRQGDGALTAPWGGEL